MNTNTDNFIFQELELEHYVGHVYKNMPGPQSGLVPIIRMFGVTRSGNSVCCHVHGFSPYFYVNLPDTFTTADLPQFKVSKRWTYVINMNYFRLPETIPIKKK